VYTRGGDLYAIAVDGSRRVRLTRNGVFRTEPVLSSDGRRVAYIRRNYTELWVGTADGRPGTRVVSEPHGVDRPAWTFDGRTLVFPRFFVGNQHGATCGALFVVGRDGRGLRRVTDPGGHSHLNPSVSPDGRVAFLDWNACEGGTA
jgi:Tol biopolymer transport system component